MGGWSRCVAVHSLSRSHPSNFALLKDSGVISGSFLLPRGVTVAQEALNL